MKKRNMKTRKSVALGLAVVLGLGQTVLVSADQAAIDAARAEAAATAQMQAQISESISVLESQKNEILGQLDEVEVNIVTTIAAINSLTEQITVKEGELEVTTANLGAAEEQKAVEYKAMKKRIQYIYETGGDAGWATILLEESSISDFLNQVEYTQKMYSYDRECLENYAAIVQQVSDLQAQQSLEKAELEEARAGQQEQEVYFEQLKDELRATSDNYDAQLAECSAKASMYQEILNEQNAAISRLVEEQTVQMAAAARAAAESAAAAQAAEAQQQAAAAQQAAAQAAAIAQQEASNAAAAQAAVEAAQAAQQAQQAAQAAAAQQAAEAAAQQAADDEAEAEKQRLKEEAAAEKQRIKEEAEAEKQRKREEAEAEKQRKREEAEAEKERIRAEKEAEKERIRAEKEKEKAEQEAKRQEERKKNA
ncbi:MAG: hypothetical protein MJ116_07930, partial [Lachnospiraceae bacterium]|nr:hypothetical protein [Lachnospiraceae bacterium]